MCFMKANIIFSVLIMVFMNSVSGQEIYRTIHDNRFMDKVNAIIQTTDGNYLLAGQTVSAGEAIMKGLILKVDENGQIIWKKELGINSSRWLEIFDVEESSDHTYVLTGREQANNSSSFDLFLCRISQDGDLLWEKLHGDTSGETGYKLLSLKDNSIIVAGNSSSTGNGGDKMLVVRFDGNGGLVWSKTIGDAQPAEAYHLIALKDHAILLVGTCGNCKKMTKNLSLVKMDGNGNTIWKKVIESPHCQVGFDAIEDNKGNIIVSGISKKEKICRNYLMFAQISSGGKLNWQEDLKMDGCVGKTSIVSSDGEGFFIGGTLYNFEKNSSAIFIMKMNQKGKMEWRQMVGGGLNETCNTMILNRDKDIIIAGEVTDRKLNTDILFVKANGSNRH